MDKIFAVSIQVCKVTTPRVWVCGIRLVKVALVPPLLGVNSRLQRCRFVLKVCQVMYRSVAGLKKKIEWLIYVCFRLIIAAAVYRVRGRGC